jgi:hypothetical protein
MKFIDYVEMLKLEARKKNIRIVREEIDKSWVKTKIDTFITAWDGICTAEELKEQILTNDIVAAKFAKDPGRQNIGEIAVNNLLGADKKLGVNQVRFDANGEMVSGPACAGCSKSADYFLEDEVYYTQKFTTGFGGAQDLAYHDVVEYLEKGSVLYKVGAILDGTYWNSGKRDSLKRYFADNPNVIIVSMDDIKQYEE